MSPTVGMPPVQYFDGRPLYESPRFPGAYRPAIYQNPGPDQLRDAFLARAPVPVRPAGQIYTYAFPFAFPSYSVFLSRAGIECARWNSLPIAQKRSEVAAVLFGGNTLRALGLGVYNYPFDAQASIDLMVSRVDAYCLANSGYGYYTPYLRTAVYPFYYTSWPFIRFARPANSPTSKPSAPKPAGQVVATNSGVDVITGLLGLAISFGVVYAGAYYGAKHAIHR